MAGPDDDRRLPSVPLRPVAQGEVIKLIRSRAKRPLRAVEALAMLRARVQELEQENERLRHGPRGGPA
jgi:hypothetical protein